MQPLNAIDAIAPAFTRSNELLFSRPRKWGRIWKLSVTSYVAYIGSIFIPYPLFLLFIPHEALPMPMMRAGLLAFSVIPFAVYLAIFYCCVRMEFVEFEMVVTKSKFIAPMWKRYGSRTCPWLLAKVVIGTVLGAAFAPLIARVLRAFFLQMQSMPQTPGAQQDPAQFLAVWHTMMGLQLFFMGAMLVLKLFGTLLNDFVLPFYTLEEISFWEALRRGAAIIAAEPFHILGYLALKLMLSMLGFIALYIGLLVCMIPIILIAVVVGLVGGAIAHAIPGSGGKLVTVAGGIVLFGGLYLAFLALVFGAMGYLMNVLESYGIYFMGGRYQRLGDYLEPRTPDYTYSPPPTLPSADERDDDSGDPPLPMDPALA